MKISIEVKVDSYNRKTWPQMNSWRPRSGEERQWNKWNDTVGANSRKIISFVQIFIKYVFTSHDAYEY